MSRDIYVVVEHREGLVEDISFVGLAAARAMAEGIGGEVVAVVLGDGRLIEGLAADRAIVVEDPGLSEYNPEAYVAALEAILADDLPRALLAGDTSVGAEVAGLLSARLDLPLVNRCVGVRAEGEALGFTAQICGGKILVDGLLPEPTVLVTVVPGGFAVEEGKSETAPSAQTGPRPTLDELRVRVRGHIEPDVGDVDISRESVLIGVGRGIQQEDTVELADELAGALGGAVCASRPVVDQGWLPTSRLVGKSGRRVKPSVYLALGISGAPEHVEGMADSDLIVAVNTDPTAPIYDVAQYGIEMDINDLLPTLLERVQEAKG